MANYTTEVRTICEVYAGETEQQGYNKIPEIVEKAAPKIFEEFEIFDEDYRLPLEIKILRHFYTREICMETVGLWKLHFNNKMNEIMPYYNQLYKSALLEFNPFYDVDYTREHDRQNDGNTDTDVENNREDEGLLTRDNEGKQRTDFEQTNLRDMNEESDREYKGNETTDNDETATRTPNLNTKYTPNNLKTHEVNKFLDTPQGNVGNLNNGYDGYLTDLRDVDTTQSGSSDTLETGTDKTVTNTNSTVTTDNSEKGNRNVTDLNTEDSIRKNEHSDSTTENTSNSTTEKTKTKTNTSNFENFFEKVRGKQGTKSYSKMLEEFRKTFLNIDMMIINDLEPLFFGLW